jgi:hypothetical protein
MIVGRPSNMYDFPIISPLNSGDTPLLLFFNLMELGSHFDLCCSFGLSTALKFAH